MSDHAFLVSEIKRWKSERDDLRRRLGRLRKWVRMWINDGYIESLAHHTTVPMEELRAALSNKPPTKRRGK